MLVVAWYVCGWILGKVHVPQRALDSVAMGVVALGLLLVADALLAVCGRLVLRSISAAMLRQVRSLDSPLNSSSLFSQLSGCNCPSSSVHWSSANGRYGS